jgi:hypothetical protein
MEEKNHADGNNPAQYIRSNNMDNTIDNKQRNTKEEDPLNPDYTNPPLGNKEKQFVANNSDASNNEIGSNI